VGDTLIPGLADELGRAAVRQHRQRRRRLRATAVGVVATVAVAAGVLTATVDAPPAAAGVEIEVRNGRIFVRLTDLEARAGLVEAVLRDAGIDAGVTAEPVGPSNLGRFVQSRSDLPEAEQLDLRRGTYATLVVPTGHRGRLTIVIGRPAEPGERYVTSSDAVAPGEPLACLDVLGRPARQLAEIAEDRPGVTIEADAFGTDASGAHVIVASAIPASSIASSPYADWIVIDAQATAADRVKVHLTVDGRDPAPEPRPPPAACD
jgi:hypothetical protein